MEERRETAGLIGSDKVEGTAVYGADGAKIGSIDRVMIDKVSGKVSYAVLSFGGFLGNLAMGLIFGVLFLRWRRVTPMIIAHSLIDMTAFVGYVALHGKVSWLP